MLCNRNSEDKSDPVCICHDLILVCKGRYFIVVFAYIIRTKKNDESSSTTRGNISSFDLIEVEIFEYFIVVLFMGHSIYQYRMKRVDEETKKIEKQHSYR